MRTIFLFMAVLGAALLVAAGTAPVMAVAPGIEWQRLLGGNNSELGYSINQTADGGYILAGSSRSSQNGDVEGINRGGWDFWLVKMNGAGVIEGKRLIGGSGDETAYSVQQTADGGYIVVGDSTSSTSWDVAGANHGPAGTSDVWVVKLDAAGAIQRQLLLGGTGDDHGRCVRQTSDGGYILVGDTTSPFLGDPPLATHGGSDVWVARLDAAGTLLWYKPLGGSGDEYGYSVEQTADEGYVLVGNSKSATITEGGITDTNHDPTGASSDMWVVKLGPGGATQSHMLLGGDKNEVGRSILQTSPDGGYIIVGYSTSSENGDVTGTNHGENDLWVVKLGPLGGIQQQRLLGGTESDMGYSVEQAADGGYIILGESDSMAITEGGMTETGHSSTFLDYWVVRLGPGGATQWHSLLGGRSNDEGYSAQQTADGGYILFGYSFSGRSVPGMDGDVAGSNHGEVDQWVVKLYADAPAVLAVPPSTLVPTDTNADGKYEDVNGNGRKDFADVVLFFNQMTWIAANEPIAAFDYNGNGRIDFADVVWLFNHL